jgi:MFS family permease
MSYRRILVALIITTFTDSLAEELLQPLIVVLLEQQDVSTFLIGLTTSSGDLGVLLAAPFVPLLIQIIRPVSYVRWSLLFIGFGIFLFPLFPNVYAWIVFDFLLGVVTCGYFVLSDSLINAAAKERYRGRLLAVYMLAESGGAILGPLLLSRVGFEGFRPFVVAAVIMFAGIAPWFFLGPIRTPSLGEERPTGFLALVRAAPLVLIAAVAAAFFGDVPASLLPVFAIDAGLAETTAVLLLAVLAAGTVVFQLPLGWGADALSRRMFLLILCAGTIISSLLLLPLVTHRWLVWPLVLVLGGFFRAFDLLALALLGERANARDLASLSAAVTMSGSVGSFLGPPSVGLLMDATGPGALFVACAVVAAVVMAAAMADPVGRRGRRSQPSTQQ